MKKNLIFYFSCECRNSISALVAGIRYFSKENDIEISYASTYEDLKRNIKKDCINILAFSVTTVNFYSVYNLFSRLKVELINVPEIIYIAGGPQADGDPESLIRAGFDIVFSGYSEEAFPRFLNQLSYDSLEKGKIIYSQTSSIWHRRSFAAFANNYFPPLEIQRGCRYRCNFCQSCIRLNRPIYKSVDAIDEYIEEFCSRGFKRFAFISPDAFDIRFSFKDRSYENISSLFEYLNSRGIKIIEYGQFPSEIRPFKDTDRYFYTLSRYTRNRRVVIGAQSLVDERLKKIRRSHTVEDVESTMESAHRYGFFSIVDIIFGFPDESDEERHFTLKRFKELNKRYPSRLHIHYFLPLAGTELYMKNPTRLDEKTLTLLDKMERDGRARGWWREGEEMVRRIIEMRDRFSSK